MNEYQDKRIFIHRIDSDDNIIFVNDNWLSFASENDAHDLLLKGVLNQSLWDFMADTDTHHLYRIILEKVRTHQLSLKFSFRCDSPVFRRFMELEVRPFQEDGVEFKSRVLKLESREPIKLLDAGTDRSSDVVKMCGWCKKVYAETMWVEIEEAIERLNLFGISKPPQTTHGICPSCNENVSQTLA